jgi:hypothetical protein
MKNKNFKLKKIKSNVCHIFMDNNYIISKERKKTIEFIPCRSFLKKI